MASAAVGVASLPLELLSCLRRLRRLGGDHGDARDGDLGWGAGLSSAGSTHEARAPNRGGAQGLHDDDRLAVLVLVPHQVAPVVEPESSGNVELHAPETQAAGRHARSLLPAPG